MIKAKINKKIQNNKMMKKIIIKNRQIINKMNQLEMKNKEDF